MTEPSLPLAGFRVLDYSQFVAGPFATMLLADLGADVIKVEPPAGDAYRHYEPLGDGESPRFYALNRNKRSIVCDLKSADGRRLSRALIATADAVVHNMPPQRAAAFGLDRESIREANPLAVVAEVSAFGSAGPHAGRIGYDLIAQSYSGLLMADARLEDDVPRRCGGIPYSDITAGLLACISVAAGLAARPQGGGRHFEISLLGAALATQVQTFVRIAGDVPGSAEATDGSPPAEATDGSAPAEATDGSAPAEATSVSAGDLERVAAAIEAADELEPYYRCYAAADGFFALTCLTTVQRDRVLAVLGLSDEWRHDPQQVPASAAERAERAGLAERFATKFRQRPASYWTARLSDAGVPAVEVRLVEQLFDDEQVRTNGLVRRVNQRRAGPVDLLGSVFKINGVAEQLPIPAPRLGEHTEALMAELAAGAGNGRAGAKPVAAESEPGGPRAS